MIAKTIYKIVNKFLSKKSKKAKTIYQYCTAFPSETVQAQTFSTELIYQVGQAVAKEMIKYNVNIWLAPGINIQRHQLCGRNYKYYSEDPYLTAKCASALTKGVQENNHLAVTIKHFCCNNQEDNRFYTSSKINERSLREIYLKAFKLTFKETSPKCLMTSYNKVNGTYVNSSELINIILRNEFSFNGLIMTD